MTKPFLSVLQRSCNIITTVGTDDLVAALDGNSFAYLNSSGNVAQAAVSSPATIVWSATAGSTGWNTGANWVGGSKPNAAKREGARIQASSNHPELNNHIQTGDLTIDSGAKLTVNSGDRIEVSYDLVNNGTIEVKNEGSLNFKKKDTKHWLWNI